MTKFDEAARKAADNVCDLFDFDKFERSDDISGIITKHFAEIEAVHGKLLELVDLQHKKLILTAGYMTPESYTEMNSSRQGFDLNIKIGDIRRDPLFKEALDAYEKGEAQ